MRQLTKSTLSDSPVYDFGSDSTIDEVSLKREPGSLPVLTLRVSAKGELHTIHCSGFKDTDEAGLMFEAWALKIFDLSRVDGFHHDFGRFVVEFTNNEDCFPWSFSVDSVSIVGESPNHSLQARRP